MRLKVPLTGTVLKYDPKLTQMGGLGVVGDNGNPVKLIDINLGNVSWTLVTIDLVNDLAEIEVSPGESISDANNSDNPEDWTSRPATEEEKQGFLNYAKSQVESHTKDELYTMTNSPRLIKPAEAVELYKQRPPNVAAKERLLSQG